MVQHPYFPLGVNIPDYVPNDLSTLQLLCIIGGCCMVTLATVTADLRWRKPDLPLHEVMTVLWFTLCEWCNESSRRTIAEVETAN